MSEAGSRSMKWELGLCSTQLREVMSGAIIDLHVLEVVSPENQAVRPLEATIWEKIYNKEIPHNCLRYGDTDWLLQIQCPTLLK